jgi:puromycin-sensitive aminopeptidase
MSTYLLAFIVGDLEFIEGKTKDGVLVRVFTTPGKKHQGKFALDTAIRCLEFYNQYFNIPYPLPVLDLIAIPDFSSAAMENWGAITYRETALLVDAENSSLSNKQWVAIVIAHEIAHQWFGNLVTMEWWTHLWLNEGFASYMEYLCTDALFPQWHMWEQYVGQRFNHALELDALSNTHPIEVEVHHPDEISEIFDAVSYAKGSVVIRMLAEYLGAKNFRDGLRYYLKKHSYQNASTVHLWEAFEKVSKKPVKALMKNWTATSGYPLLKITEGQKHLTVSQSRFFSSPLSQKKSLHKEQWQIPFTLETPNGKKDKHFLTGKTLAIKKPTGKWVKFNSQETSFFRTDYPAQMLGAFSSAIKNKELSSINRLGIVRDAFALAEAGHLPTAQALALAKNFINETDYNVWLVLAVGLNTVGAAAFGQSYYEDFKQYAGNIFANVAHKSGWQEKPNESSAQVLLRSLSLLQAGKWGNQKIITQAKKMFASKQKPPVNIRSVVYSLATYIGGAKEYKKLMKLYQTETLHEEKDRIARALAQFNSPKLLKKTLTFALSNKVRAQDAPFIIAGVFRNPAGSSLALDFVFKNWNWLISRYSSGLSMISRIIGVMDNFYTNEAANKIEKFYKTHKAPGAKRTLAQTLEKIRSNAAWVKRDGEHIAAWLKQNLD